MDVQPVETRSEHAFAAGLGGLFGMAVLLAVLYLLIVAVIYTVIFLAVVAERVSGRRILPSLPGRTGPPAHWLRHPPAG